MAFWRYWFRYTDPVTKVTRDVVFYDSSEKGARKQYEETYNTKASDLLRRENW